MMLKLIPKHRKYADPWSCVLEHLRLKTEVSSPVSPFRLGVSKRPLGVCRLKEAKSHTILRGCRVKRNEPDTPVPCQVNFGLSSYDLENLHESVARGCLNRALALVSRAPRPFKQHPLNNTLGCFFSGRCPEAFLNVTLRGGVHMRRLEVVV